MNNCGSKMTVPQLKVAVKAKFPKLAVSKLNKPALLDYFEGRKRANPKFPKLAPAIVKKLDASKKAGFGNTPKVAALVKDVKAGISAKKVSTMIDSVKTGMAAKKATPVPKKATPVPKKDNLPFHLMMNIRKMATDSSKQDNEKPYIKLQQMFDTRLAFWTKVNKEILDDTSPNSFASREKRLIVDERKQRYKKIYTKQLVREYSALHQMGCKINKKYFDLFWAQEATISAYKFKHKANLVHFENGSQNNNPIYKALFDTKQQILHQYAPIAHYTALKIVNDWKFEALKDASWKMGYNSNNCEWVKK